MSKLVTGLIFNKRPKRRGGADGLEERRKREVVDLFAPIPNGLESAWWRNTRSTIQSVLQKDYAPGEFTEEEFYSWKWNTIAAQARRLLEDREVWVGLQPIKEMVKSNELTARQGDLITREVELKRKQLQVQFLQGQITATTANRQLAQYLQERLDASKYVQRQHLAQFGRTAPNAPSKLPSLNKLLATGLMARRVNIAEDEDDETSSVASLSVPSSPRSSIDLKPPSVTLSSSVGRAPPGGQLLSNLMFRLSQQPSKSPIAASDIVVSDVEDAATFGGRQFIPHPPPPPPLPPAALRYRRLPCSSCFDFRR